MPRPPLCDAVSSWSFRPASTRKKAVAPWRTALCHSAPAGQTGKYTTGVSGGCLLMAAGVTNGLKYGTKETRKEEENSWQCLKGNICIRVTAAMRLPLNIIYTAVLLTVLRSCDVLPPLFFPTFSGLVTHIPCYRT